MNPVRQDDPQGSAAALPVITADGQKFWTVGTLIYTGSGLAMLFVWLLWGDFALSLRDRSVGPLIEKFLLKNGADNTWKQVLTSTIPTVIALILSPIVSYKSDRLRSRWGRRIPYLIIPTPIAGAAMIGIAFCPQIGEWIYSLTGHTPAPGVSIHLAAAKYTLSIFTVLWIIFEVAVIISGSVMGGLINDVVPRSVLGRFFGLFRAISLFDGILFNALLFKHAEQHFTLMFALIGILFGGGFTLMCLMVKEGNYPPPPVDEIEKQATGEGFIAWLIGFLKNFYGAMATYFRECFAHPYYLLLFGMFTFGALTFRPINDFSIRYAAQLKMADGDYGNLIAVSYLISLSIAFPLGMFVDRFHAIRMGILAIVLYLLTTLYGSIFIAGPFTFGISLVAHTVLSGTYFTCTASLAQALLPRSKFSQYASAGGLVTSLVVLVYGPAMGYVLDKTGNNYRLTYWAGLILSGITLLLTLIVYFRFKAMGGTKGYLAPGDEGVTPTRIEPPAHMAAILMPYFCGAVLGLTFGYILSYFLQPGAVRTAGVDLSSFHKLVLSNADVRGYAMVTAATCMMPGALVGGFAGNKWATQAMRKTA